MKQSTNYNRGKGTTYLGERIAAAERLHGAGVGSRKFLVQGGETSDEFLQILYFKILRDTVHVFFASVHSHGISAGLKGLHPDAKKVSGDLNTRQFLTAGILQLVDVLHQRPQRPKNGGEQFLRHR
jgi:hypothetical protein